MEAVATGRERLAIDQNVVRDGELRGFVGAGTPYMAIWNNRHALRASILIVERCLTFGVNILRRIAPDVAALNGRPAVDDRYVRDPDGLHHTCLLAGPGQAKLAEANAAETNTRMRIEM